MEEELKRKAWRNRVPHFNEVRVYCRLRGICIQGFKRIDKSPAKKGLYYIHCINPDGCSHKTFFTKQIRIENQRGGVT